MNPTTRSRLVNGKKRIERRLSGRAWIAPVRPMVTTRSLAYEMSEKSRAIAMGGAPAMLRMARELGLVKRIDETVRVLKSHLPYHESDHVLNITLNTLCGGTCLEDIEHQRLDENLLNSIGAQRIPDPTTAGDFCRRFEERDVQALMNAINETRVPVWRRQRTSFFEQEAIIEADGAKAPTLGECKQGMDITYDGEWGYHPLIVSLANTAEPLFLVNRPGNRPSHEGAADYFDRASVLVREAGFKDVTFRGDTDFSQTKHLDRWDAGGIRFVFGYDCTPNLVKLVEALPGTAWSTLARPAKYEITTEPRRERENVKEQIVRARGFLNLYLLGEDVAEFDYTPTACNKPYRMVVVRKNLSRERGEQVLFTEYRYFFYITNRRDLSTADVVFFANDRCNQENLIAQLRSGVRALRMPVDTLVSNWAYMVMAALAWSLKAWFALLIPVHGRWREQHEAERSQVLRMEFRTFVSALIAIPAQVVCSGRRIILRVLTWKPMLHVFFRTLSAIGVPC